MKIEPIRIEPDWNKEEREKNEAKETAAIVCIVIVWIALLYTLGKIL